MGLGTKHTGRATRQTQQSSRPQAVAKPFNDRAREVYQNILQSKYEDEIAKILANTQKKEDCREIARLLLIGEHGSKLTRLSNISEEEEQENAKSRIQELLSKFQAIHDETDTLHLFISAPLDDEEQALREEQFEVYAGKNPFITSAPGKEDSNAVVIKVERQWSPGAVVSSFIKKASKLPDVKQLSIVVNGHGGREGTVLLAGQHGRKEEVANDEIIRSVNQTLNGSKHGQWPQITLVLAQCFAHKFDQEAACEMNFDIVWFTTDEKPETTNRPAVGIRNKWHHKELDTYAESFKPTIFSLKEKKREAKKRREEEEAVKRKQEQEEQARKIKRFKAEKKLQKLQHKRKRVCLVGPFAVISVVAFVTFVGPVYNGTRGYKCQHITDITEEIPILDISLPDIDFQPISGSYIGSLFETSGNMPHFFNVLLDSNIRPLISEHLNMLLLSETKWEIQYKQVHQQSFAILRLKGKASDILLRHPDPQVGINLFSEIAVLEETNSQLKEVIDTGIACLRSQYQAIITILKRHPLLTPETVKLINEEIDHGLHCLKKTTKKAERMLHLAQRTCR